MSRVLIIGCYNHQAAESLLLIVLGFRRQARSQVEVYPIRRAGIEKMPGQGSEL